MKNKNGVSAVIGVILMVAITVAIAATVYVYVAGYWSERGELQNIVVSGNVTKIVQIWDDGDVDYNITLDYYNSYIIVNDDVIWRLGGFYELYMHGYDGIYWRLDYYTVTRDL